MRVLSSYITGRTIVRKEQTEMLHSVQIKELTLKLPIIQGGMGVGISRSNLAGAVAREGGMGIISTAQIGYDEPEFYKNPIKTNLKAIKKHVALAKEKANGGIVGVNIMVATKEYESYVKASVEAGVDVIISGAGLPVSLPEYVKGSNVAIAPIVSSKKATSVILKMWDRKYNRTADFLVIEGPLAGGHLGFTKEQLDHLDEYDFDKEIKEILTCKEEYEKKYQCNIPVFVAGGIYSKEDIEHVISLGADGVQIASRFVATEECDASMEFKQAYINAKKEDIMIVNSPVGMPGRALNNTFIKKVAKEGKKVTNCYSCLSGCNPTKTCYCITEALINAVKGKLDDALLFVGENVFRIDKMTTVHNLMVELTQ